tara:strand:- start:356 stop:784 length:429 start_codon:yes stop_codon:yes gene_type:complete
MTAITLRTPAVLGRTAFDQIFDQFFNDPRPMIKRSTDGYPLTDIYKDEEDNQVIEVALAGFSKEDIQIEIKDNTITISHNSGSWKGEDRPSRRIARRAFSKTFVDYHNKLDLVKSTATFENGLLTIIIPEVAEKQAIMINIT